MSFAVRILKGQQKEMARPVVTLPSTNCVVTGKTNPVWKANLSHADAICIFYQCLSFFL